MADSALLEEGLTPQERHAAECAAKAALKEWNVGNFDLLELSSMLNTEIVRAVRVVREKKDCA